MWRRSASSRGPGRTLSHTPRRPFRPAPASRHVAGVALLAAALLLLPGGVAAQGWIEPDPGLPRMPDVVKVRSDVEVRIRRGVAHVEVSEWFENRGRRVAQGDYHYPLPADAAFRSYSLVQGEEELRGEIMDAREARRIYEEIVRRRLDPALIELAGTGLLRARVFPIEPGDTRKITLRYTQLLPRAGEALHFRYAGGVRNAQPRPPEIGRPPEVRPLPRGRPAPAVKRPDRETPDGSFFVEVEEGEHFLDPFSPTHDLEVERVRGRVRVRADGGLSGTFSLFLPLSREALGLGLATHAPVGENGYVMLTLSPGEADVRPQPRDLTVVLDVSGSMSGDKLRQAQDALHGLLETLEADDCFRLVAFSNSVRPHALESRRATPEAVADARRWVDRLEANGGTNIEAALGEAFRLAPSEERLPVVIFLTDGLPTVGEQSVERLAARAEERRGRSRVFAFGVGHDVNTHLLDRMTSAGRGTTTYVEPGESVERSVSLLTTRIRHPVLTDVELVESPVRLYELYPVEIPDVFAGEALVLLGRYETAGDEVRGDVVIRGRRAGREERFVVEARFPARSEADAYLPRLWASRKLGFLTRRVWTEGASPELVEEIRATALRYGLPSEYTSYLVTEPGAALALDEAMGERAAEARALTAAAPADASGAGAVRAAREAGELRSVTSSADLQELEVRASRGFADGDGGVRRLAGRFFRREGETWVDVTRTPDAVLEVKAYSQAYFALLEALPELRPYATGLKKVQVGGGDLAVRIGDEGREHLDDAELADAVRRFRAWRGADGSR